MSANAIELTTFALIAGGLLLAFGIQMLNEWLTREHFSRRIDPPANCGTTVLDLPEE